MRKTVSIVLVMSLLLVFGTVCYADTGGQIPGEYKLFLVDVMGQQSDSDSMGISASLILREDGTGVMISNGTEDPLPSWTEENGKVTLYNSGGNTLEIEVADGIIEMEMAPGYYMCFARTGVDTAGYAVRDHSPSSMLYGIYKSMDANKGAHLSYDYHSDYMDSLSTFDVHTRNGVLFSLRKTQSGGYEQLNANCFKDGKSYVLYPNEMRGTLAASTSSGIITENVLMLDDLYGVIYQRALRSDFTVESRELEGVSYTVEVYPGQGYVQEAAFYYDETGQLIHVLVGAPQTAPELGETFYTIYAIDEAVNDALFDISGYTITG